jgi:two-component system response regulator AgrA
MLEFIICDDDKNFLSKVENFVNKVMLKKDIEYKIYKFTDYDKKFMEMIKVKENPRIYVLDIELPTASGITIGRQIRKRDLESQIIFLTGHEELGSLLLRKDVNFLAFINKFEEFEERLKKNLEMSLLTLNKKKFLELKDKKSYYRLSLDSILYLTRDSVERKTVVYTNNNTHTINKSLKDIENYLDDRFVKTHRSCIINRDRIAEINYKTREIIFDNGSKIDFLSKKYKLEAL